MWYFTEIADWFDNEKAQSDLILDRWVDESHYNHGVMIVAATAKSFTTFGAGFVDVLKLGDGIKGGTLKGVGQDALRVVAIFPVGKVAGLLKSANGVASAKLVADTGGRHCFWVTSAKAFAQIGQKSQGKLLASVEDIAKTLGMSMDALWKIPNLSIGIAYLQQLGAKVGLVKSVETIRDVERMVPFDGSVVIVTIGLMKPGEAVGHAIYAFRNAFGKIRYMDRSLGKASDAVFESIASIGIKYGATSVEVLQAAVLHNVFVKTLAHDLHRLVMPILGIIASEKKK